MHGVLNSDGPSAQECVALDKLFAGVDGAAREELRAFLRDPINLMDSGAPTSGDS